MKRGAPGGGEGLPLAHRYLFRMWYEHCYKQSYSKWVYMFSLVGGCGGSNINPASCQPWN